MDTIFYRNCTNLIDLDLITLNNQIQMYLDKDVKENFRPESYRYEHDNDGNINVYIVGKLSAKTLDGTKKLDGTILLID